MALRFVIFKLAEFPNVSIICVWSVCVYISKVEKKTRTDRKERDD